MNQPVEDRFKQIEHRLEKIEQEHFALWEIAQEVVRKYAYPDNALGDVYCMFCGMDNYLNNIKDVEHEASCIVLKARALVASRDKKESSSSTKKGQDYGEM